MLVDRPDRTGRREIFESAYGQSTACPECRSRSDRWADAGFSRALTLPNLVNEAAIVATRRNGDAVTLDDFTIAIQRIIAGLEKKSRVLGPEERRRVAYHDRCVR